MRLNKCINCNNYVITRCTNIYIALVILNIKDITLPYANENGWEIRRRPTHLCMRALLCRSKTCDSLTRGKLAVGGEGVDRVGRLGRSWGAWIASIAADLVPPIGPQTRLCYDDLFVIAHCTLPSCFPPS